MCSGCAGDYAGGFDSDDPDSDDPEDPIVGATSASFRGTSDKDLGGNDLGETDLAQGMGGGTAGLGVPEDASEICEILVTSTHILEIRVISANWQGQGRSNDRLGKMPAALPPHAASKHSSGASAKYYQTRQGSEKTRGCPAHSLGISRSFAGVCKAKLNEWFRETRRLLRRCTPQSG